MSRHRFPNWVEAIEDKPAGLPRRLDNVRASFELGREILPSAQITAEVALSSYLRCTAISQTTARSTQRRRRIVCRAEAFFRCHASEGISVADLSRMVGVSERSLRNAVHAVYTTSPKRFMRLWQLHEVRRGLRSAGINGRTVTEIATDHGFFELGRFAGAYKALFGEAPSETLHHARKERHAYTAALAENASDLLPPRLVGVRA
jgi:AraC-like DNA-binding protein